METDSATHPSRNWLLNNYGQMVFSSAYNLDDREDVVDAVIAFMDAEHISEIKRPSECSLDELAKHIKLFDWMGHMGCYDEYTRYLVSKWEEFNIFHLDK
jgi:hypothetical protein